MHSFSDILRLPTALKGKDKEKAKEKEKEIEKGKEKGKEKDNLAAIAETMISPSPEQAHSLNSSSALSSSSPLPSSFSLPLSSTSLPISSSLPSLPFLKKKDSQTPLNSNSTDLWGPILVLCKARDLTAWEEGIYAVFNCRNLQHGENHSDSRLDTSSSFSPDSIENLGPESVSVRGVENSVKTGEEVSDVITDRKIYDNSNTYYNDNLNINNNSKNSSYADNSNRNNNDNDNDNDNDNNNNDNNNNDNNSNNNNNNNNNNNYNNNDNNNNNNSRIRMISYFGSDTDRALIRSYLFNKPNDNQNLGPGSTSSSSSSSGSGPIPGGTSGNNVWSGLYGERSPCHIILTTYESFMSDISDFLGIFWNSVVFDSPWGLISNTHENKSGNNYLGLQDDIMNLKARHRLFTCYSLSNSFVPISINSLCSSSGMTNRDPIKSIIESNFHRANESKIRVTFPDLVACAVMVFPSLQNVVQFPSDTDEVTALSTATSMKENSLCGTSACTCIYFLSVERLQQLSSVCQSYKKRESSYYTPSLSL